jgi:putative component of membrane protein insertase Oxa1/YidC/SpoIIIJ protein YidD
MPFKIVICLFLFLFQVSETNAQTKKDFSLAKTLFTPKAKDNFKQFANKNNNQLESTFSLLFMGYKTFISSQDMDMCVFEPSCSVYAIQCIHHEKNKVIACLKISDRLMRCHPLDTKGSYVIDFKTGKKLDPIEN